MILDSVPTAPDPPFAGGTQVGTFDSFLASCAPFSLRIRCPRNRVNSIYTEFVCDLELGICDLFQAYTPTVTSTSSSAFTSWGVKVKPSSEES
jgi:hypothetical protein